MNKVFSVSRETAARLGLALLPVLALVGSSTEAWATCGSDTNSDCTILDVADFSIYSGNVGDEGRVVINIDDCRDLWDDTTDVVMEWSLKAAIDAEVYSVKTAANGDTCDVSSVDAVTDDDCTTFPRTSSRLSQDGDTITFTTTFAELLGLTAIDECNDASITGIRRTVALVYQDAANGEDTATATAARFQIELQLSRPTAPTSVAVEAGGSTLNVSWDTDLTDVEYRVYFSETPFFEGESPDDLVDAKTAGPTSDTSLSVSDGVSEDRVYSVGVVTIDDIGNESLLSEVVVAETVPTSDFWQRYQDLGGVEEGGYCAVTRGANPGGLGMFGLVALGIVVPRMRRRRLAAVASSAVAALAVVATAPTVSAQSTLNGIEDDREWGTPITSALELRLSPFDPAVGDLFEGTNPWEETFGSRNPWNLEVEYDYQFWRGIGSAAVSFEMGFARVSGQSVDDTGARTPDKTRFARIPFRVGAVYRFDYLQERWGVPLVIALKAGLDYHLWKVRGPDGVSEFETDGGDTLRARGATHGWHAGIAAHLLLDFFAPGMARGFDASVGVNNSYLFAEYRYENINDFGDAKSWDLSSPSVVFGLAFEF